MRSGACDYDSVCMCVCARSCGIVVHDLGVHFLQARARFCFFFVVFFFPFFPALPLAFLMQHRTLSPGLLGDRIMFLSLSLSFARSLFLSSLGKREPIAALLPSERGGLFSLHFHRRHLPVDSYRRNKSNSDSISIHVSFLQ